MCTNNISNESYSDLIEKNENKMKEISESIKNLETEKDGIKKRNEEKSVAKMVFKRLKACRFDMRLMKRRFELTIEEKRAYDSVYGRKYGSIW